MATFWSFLVEFFALYFPIVLGVVSQIVFLAFPVALQNWQDDDLYAFTYVGIQTLMAAAIFVGVPIMLDVFVLGWCRGLWVLMVVMIAASIRVYRIVPLELSFTAILKSEPVRPIQFADFGSALRSRALAELHMTDFEEARRYRNVRETLSRKRILMEISSRAESRS